MKIRNLTPHKITIMNGDQTEIFETNGIARVSSIESCEGSLDFWGNNIPLVSLKLGVVEGLPEQKDGEFLIVSRMVKTAIPSRGDCIVPHGIIRDKDGQIIGCKGFSL